jgi:aspartyl-tRNA(Asn)/glutamyl-tRNA(Gln) amidotransferase subunit A
MADAADLGVRELLDAFRARRLSPVEALDACAARIAAVDGELNAFTVLCLERAREEAVAAQASYAPGAAPGPLTGVPFAAKDIFDTAEVPTSYGSAMFAGHVPAADAEPIARLRAAGAILVGKTRTHEFAWGITSVNHRMGTPRNPRDPRRVAGGSSGGSGVAVASGQVPLALGTDTGGSIRIPASFCGVSGIKPTFGAVARAGVWPLAATLDHVGPLARDAADLAPALAALAASVDRPVPVGRLRAAICPDLHLVSLAPAVRAAFERATAVLGELTAGPPRALRLAGAERIRTAFAAIQGAEAIICHRRAGLFPARAAEYGADLRGRLEAGGRVTLEAYAEATETRLELAGRVDELLRDRDVVITPVTAVAPSTIDDPDHVEHEGRRVELRDCVLPFTVPQNLLGVPACAVPAGTDDAGLPIAVQLWGRRGDDATVVAAAAALQAALGEGQLMAGA